MFGRIMFLISKISLYRSSFYRGSIRYILFWPRRRMSFVISRTSVNRGSLNRGPTVIGGHPIHKLSCLFVCLFDLSLFFRFGRRVCHGIIMILTGVTFLVVLLVHKGEK